MASATLTKAVKQLAMPVMGGSRFVVVDADREVCSQSNKVPVKFDRAQSNESYAIFNHPSPYHPHCQFFIHSKKMHSFLTISLLFMFMLL